MSRLVKGGFSKKYVLAVSICFAFLVVYEGATLGPETTRAYFLNNSHQVIPLFRPLFYFALYHCQRRFPMLCHLDLNGLNSLLPFNLSSACMLMYFIMGGLIHQQKDKLKELSILKLLLCLLMSLILLTVRWTIIKDVNHVPYDAIFNGTMTISGMIIAVSMFLMAIKIKALPSYSHKLLQTTAKNTLFVFTHIGLSVIPF